MFVDDITAFMNGVNKELVEMAEKVLKKLIREEEEKGLKKIKHRRREKGKSKAITSCKYLDERFQECRKKKTSCFGDECGDAGGGLENEDQTSGRRRRREERSAIFAYQENQVFHENYMRTGERMLWRTGVSIVTAEKAEVEEASGSSSRKEGVGFALTYHGSEQVGSYHGHARSGARGLVGNMVKKKQKARRKQIFEVQTWRQVSLPAGTVMCETSDLGIKWPHWHTLLFEGQVAVDMRVACPQDVRTPKDHQIFERETREVFGYDAT